MLVFYKERYGILLRIIATAVVCLFVFSDISFALAPKLSLTQPQFEEEYLARSLLLTEKTASQYARANSNMELVREAGGTRIIGVKGFLKNIGQIAWLDIDNETAKPLIRVDSNYFYNDTVMGFETAKIAAFEAVRSRKGFTYNRMASWLMESHDKPDADIGGMTSRQWADSINEKAQADYPGIVRLYDRIKAKYRKALLRGQTDRADGLLNFASMYSFYRSAGGVTDKEDARINMAAHESSDAVNWIEENAPQLKGKTVLSLSMEGNIPEFTGYDAQNANTKGGLGAYFGDKLEGMAALGINAIGAQVGYSHIRRDGKLVRIDYSELIRKGILQKVFTNGDSIMVRAWDEDPEARADDPEDKNNPKVRVEVYKLNRGGATDYIFVSKVFDELYPDDRAHRFTQEVVFGKAVYAFMEKMALKPDILHLNEAHTVVAAAQMRADEAYNNTAIVYTNHTLVPEGLETFSTSSVKSSVDRMMYVIGLPGKKAAQLRSVFLRPDGVVDFCYAAIKLADIINAVSKEHALATKKLFRRMYGSEFNSEVIGILNGSGQTWKSDKLIEFESAARKPDASVAWDIHESGKAEAFAEIEKRTGVRLDPARPTAWAVRRLVEYKSQYPILKFIVHLMTADKTRTFTREELKGVWARDITNFRQDYERNHFRTRDVAEAILDRIFSPGVEKVNGLGMQVVVGWPVPAPDNTGFWESEFRKWMELPDLKGRFVAVESDAQLLKMQAIGADICINMPQPLKEACGTSDQRTGLNFGVNIAIGGAGPAEWIEEYNEIAGSGSGFLIDSYTTITADGIEADMERFYGGAPVDIFSKAAVCSRLFYEDGKEKWKQLMLNSYLRANETVTAVAMEKRYALDAYIPALRTKTGIVSVSDGKGTPAQLLETIKNNELLLAAARDVNNGVSVNELVGQRRFKARTVQKEFKAARDLGIFVSVSPGSIRMRFSDMMLGPDKEFTGTAISAVNDIRCQIGKHGEDRPLHRGEIPSNMIGTVREFVKMAVTGEIEKEFVAPDGMTMYHIIEQDVIPVGQRSTLVQAVNNTFYRDNKGSERIMILNEKQNVADVIAEIKARDAFAVIDVALSDESHIGAASGYGVKRMVVKTERSFIDLNAVLKALRALHYESADETMAVMCRLYTIMAGQSMNARLRVVSGVYIFNLPRTEREDTNNIPKLNERLLQLLTAA